jgi:hypothetical protein
MNDKIKSCFNGKPVGFASIIGGYATSETSGIFSDNKQWNPVQVRYCLGHGFTMDGKHGFA